MSTTPGALEIVREAFGRMRTPVAVDVPSSREERAAAWGRLKETLVNWTVPTDDPAFTGFDPAKPGSHQTVVVRRGLPTSVRDCLDPAKPGSDRSAVFRTSMPASAWRELTPYEKSMQPMVDRTLAVIERRMADMKAQLATLTEAYDRRGQTIRELYEERDRAQAQLAAFTAQNVRPLDEKPAPPPIFRAIAPSTKDPRRLGLA